MSANLSVSGADTRVCRLDNRVEASLLVRAGPPVVLGAFYEPCLYRIGFNVRCNARILFLIANPMIVRFGLPEWLARAVKHPVRLPRGEALQRLQQTAEIHYWQQQNVYVIGHHHKSSQLVVTQCDTFMQTLHDHLGELWPTEE